MSFTIRATVLQTSGPDQLEAYPDAVIEVGDSFGGDAGVITAVRLAEPAQFSADIMLGSDYVLMPGFIDLHLHAPQWPQLGTGLDLPLDEWLRSYTFPLEARCADLDYAKGVVEWPWIILRELQSHTAMKALTLRLMPAVVQSNRSGLWSRWRGDSSLSAVERVFRRRRVWR